MRDGEVKSVYTVVLFIYMSAGKDELWNYRTGTQKSLQMLHIPLHQHNKGGESNKPLNVVKLNFVLNLGMVCPSNFS